MGREFEEIEHARVTNKVYVRWVGLCKIESPLLARFYSVARTQSVDSVVSFSPALASAAPLKP